MRLPYTTLLLPEVHREVVVMRSKQMGSLEKGPIKRTKNKRTKNKALNLVVPLFRCSLFAPLLSATAALSRHERRCA